MYWYKNLPDQQTYEDLKLRDSPSARIQRGFIEFLILCFLLVIAYFLFSGFSYMDPRDQCFLKIKYDVLKGDRKSIIAALKRLKDEDYIFYRKFCANVDQIYEKKCTMSQTDSKKVEFIKTDGCYIKGSHAILIEPVDETHYDRIDRRIETIKKYGNMAINYWDNEAPDLFGQEEKFSIL